MQLKKCGGCARAIVESAAVCQYCGHATHSLSSPEPVSRPRTPEEDPFAFLTEEDEQPALPLTTPAGNEAPAAEATRASIDDNSLSDEPVASGCGTVGREETGGRTGTGSRRAAADRGRGRRSVVV
jgi:hypothetical protein